MFKPKGVMFFTLVIMLMGFSCSDSESDQPLLKAELPLHLEEHIEAARIEGSEVPKDFPAPVEWGFDEPQPNWKPAVPLNKTTKPAKVIHTEDALRIELNKANFNPWGVPRGGIYIELPELIREDWGYVLVQARTYDDFSTIFVCFNLNKNIEQPTEYPYPFLERERINLIRDGSVHTYLVRVDKESRRWEGPWRQLGLWFAASEPGKIDILSVSVIPKAAMYAGDSADVCTEDRNNAYRRTLYMHSPGKLEYRIKVPDGAHIDVGLGVLRKAPVTFRINAKLKNQEATTLLEETYSDSEHWAQHSVDLSSFAGKTIDLSLETEADREGTVALWAAPTLSGIRSTRKPNVIFYVIDGAGAEFMSVYGYNRRTTPNLERLAAEGAVFDYAFSNSSWSKPSTMSFMTSLYHSVLGGQISDSDPLPDQAVTMAQQMHHAGYQTAVFTTNSYCGTLSSLERGVDVLREAGEERNSISSKELHNDYWKWREEYPAEPYWVHFQTTDIHIPWRPAPPFSGLFISSEDRKTYLKWRRQFRETRRQLGDAEFTVAEIFEKAGIDQTDFVRMMRCMYDEGMSHNDYKIGKMVERLKAKGEWENTILIVAADHGYYHAGIKVLDPHPPYDPTEGPFLSSYMTRIPLIVIWPGHISPRQRFSQPVSMIDILPTILELADLPKPEVMQGQSLAPLLLGKQGWEPRPIIIDEFYVDRETGELVGNIEVLDGRWGASLRIDLRAESENTRSFWKPRPVPLLLYDLWNDPNCLNSLHEEQPDLVKKYKMFLQAQWKDNRELAKNFKRSEQNPITAEQLRTLRSLGYIR